MVNIMEFLNPLWNYVLPFLAILTILVFVHEMGHYYVARRAGVKVEAFSIGFGPEIFGWYDKHGTRWRFACVPLGGYVKMFGETERTVAEDGSERPLSAGEKAVSFQHKKLRQRAAIVFAGPFVNYVFAVIVLGILFAVAGQAFSPSMIGPVVPGSPAEKAGLKTGDKIVQVAGRNVERFEEVMQAVGLRPGQRVPIVIERDGERRGLDVDVGVRMITDKRGNQTPFGDLGAGPFVSPIVGRVVANSAAEEAGLQPGDVFVRIKGQPVETFADVQKVVMANAEVPLQVIVRRDGAEVALTVTPKMLLSRDKDSDGNAKKIGGVIGVSPKAAFRKQHGVAEAFVQAVRETYGLTIATFTAVGQMITGTRSTRDLSGPLRIAEISGDMAQLGLYQYVWFLGVLSLSLCIINLLPVPMLDGGHLLFYGFEALRGKPLGQRAQEYGFRIGLALVITLMVFATWNDLVHLKVIESIRSLFV
jgi:regulator of sigma E protease